MSLRDLATTSLCAPTGGATAASAGASSSSNPLAQLAEAVLPSSVQASRPTPLRKAAPLPHPATATDVTLDEAALLQALVPRPEQGAQLGPNHIVDYPPVHPAAHLVGPPPPFYVPLPAGLPPVPQPALGAPTDLFERAFLSAAKPVQSNASSSTHPSVTAPLPYARPLIPNFSPTPSYALQHPPAPNMEASFAAMSLQLQRQRMNPYPYIHHLPPSEQAFAPHAPFPIPSHFPVHPSEQHLQHIHKPPSVTQAAPSASDLVTTSSQPDQVGTLSHSVSWGDEFTSLESGEPLITTLDPHNDLLLEDTLQSAFQHWLRRDTSSTYEFTERHATSGKSPTEALEEGIRAHTEGRLSSAVFHLEDALNSSQSDTQPLSTSKQAMAWYMLGLSLADLDDDERAIQALMQGVNAFDGSNVGDRREDNPYLWQSLIALAVSYTNELEHTKAHRVILEWMQLRNATGDGESGVATTPAMADLFSHNDYDDVFSQLNSLAAESPNDVDVFVILGILHNLDRDYKAATVALRHAVTLRPSAPNLWNKLGATLANGGNSDDALRAYRKAVDLQPALVRAWVNVGTAYSNRAEFAKAMRYYLKAISMSQTNLADSGISTAGKDGLDSMLHVWGYLRSTLISMSHEELLPLVEKRDANGLRKHFNF